MFVAAQGQYVRTRTNIIYLKPLSWSEDSIAILFHFYFQYHGNDVEMFFVKAGSEPLLFSLDDLILAEDVVQGNLVTNVKKKVPVLNITSIYTQVRFILQI